MADLARLGSLAQATDPWMEQYLRAMQVGGAQQWQAAPPAPAPPPMAAPAPQPTGMAGLRDVAQRWLIDPAKSAINDVRNSPWLYPSSDAAASPFPEVPVADQFATSAQRVQQAARPTGGRIEGTATDRPDLGLMIPRSPLDVGAQATMLPLPLPAKVVALAAGAALEPTEAWAARYNAFRRGVRGVKAAVPAEMRAGSETLPTTGGSFVEPSTGQRLAGIGHNNPPPELQITAEDVMPRPKPSVSSVEIPDIRQLSTADAIAIARNQHHLIKSGDKAEGLYVGGPRDVQSKAALNKIRSDFDKYIAADPRGADWYDRYRRGVNEVTGGDPVANRWMANQEGQWSAGVDPGSELHFALKENNSALAGMPVKAARPAQHEAHLRAIAAKDPGQYMLGEKTGEYAAKVSPDQPMPPGATGVNDFRHARNFKYTDPQGRPIKSHKGASHKFLDYETALAVDRANRAATGDRTDWTGEKLQGAPWVRQKALDLMSRNKKLTYEEAFQRANRTIADYFDQHTAFATHEAQPGANVPGHMPLSATAEQSVKDAYARDPRSTWATAPGGRDAIYGGMSIPGTGVGMRVRPTQPMQGLYVRPDGTVETNLGEVARPLVTFDTGGKKGPFKQTTAHDKALLDAAEATRAYADAQNAGAWHKPWLGGPAKQSTSLRFPRTGPASTGELLAMRGPLGAHGLTDIVDTGKGITASRFYPGQPEPNKAFDKALRKGELEQFGTPVRARVTPADSGYVEYIDEWKQGVGSDAATKKLFEYVNKTPEIRAALNNNPYLGERALARMERDADWAAEWGAPREDIQYARKIIGDGPGWLDRLEAAIGKGLLPSLTGAALLAAGAMGQRQQGGQDAQL